MHDILGGSFTEGKVEFLFRFCKVGRLDDGQLERAGDGRFDSRPVQLGISLGRMGIAHTDQTTGNFDRIVPIPIRLLSKLPPVGMGGMLST
jgi:hypothetical protein